MKSERGHLFTEINARFGGGVPLAFKAGAETPKWLLASLAGIDVDIPPIGNYDVGLYMTRFTESQFLSEDQIAAIAGSRI